MNITIKQLQAFAAVAGSRSFAEACERLNLSQPALSIAIKNLEESVGGKLFARTTRSLALTPEGEEFYPVVRRLLSDWEQSLEDVNNLFSLRRGKLDIAAMPTFTSSLLPEILARFHGQFAGINVTVHDVVAESVVEMVSSGRAELGVTFEPGDATDLEFHSLFRDSFVALLPANHPLAAKAGPLCWRDLQDFTYITLQRPSSIRLLIDRTLQAEGIVLSPSFEAHQLVSIGRMVAQGLGLSVIPALSARQMQEMGAVTKPLDYPAIYREVGAVTRKRYSLSVAAQAMLELVVATAQSNQPPAR